MPTPVSQVLQQCHKFLLNSGNRFSFGVGIGYFENEGALAMGIKSTIDRSTNLSISLGHDTQQRTSLAAGLGWNWW